MLEFVADSIFKYLIRAPIKTFRNKRKKWQIKHKVLHVSNSAIGQFKSCEIASTLF